MVDSGSKFYMYILRNEAIRKLIASRRDMITKEEQKQFSQQLNGYGFKDQPNGHCKMCKWFCSLDNYFCCDIPDGHITNLICITKNMMIHMDNLDYYSRDY